MPQLRLRFLALVGKPDFDFALDPGPDESRPPLDLDRIIGVPDSDAAGDLPLFTPSHAERDQRSAVLRRTKGVGAVADDMPLITAPSAPRAPLGVRRATGEIPRARTRATKPALQEETLFETPPIAVIGKAFEAKKSSGGDALASPPRRITAALVDVALLWAVDAVVVYFTLRLLGLTSSEMSSMSLLPLAAFFLLLNGGYFVAFTTVGGQSIGKMALGIKVVESGRQHRADRTRDPSHARLYRVRAAARCRLPAWGYQRGSPRFA